MADPAEEYMKAPILWGAVFGVLCSVAFFAGWFWAPFGTPLREDPAPVPITAELIRTSATVTEARRAGIPPDLALAVTRWEVRNADSLAHGRAGEVGYFQVMPKLWREAFPECYPERPLWNPERNACIGVRVLRQKYEEQGTWPKALKAYNGSLHLTSLGNEYVAGVNSQRSVP